jgi:hypothetical protein
MKHLFDSPFFESVRESIRTLEPPEPEILAVQYGDFIQTFSTAIEKEESTLSLFRYVRLVHIEICHYYKQMEVCGLKNTSVLVELLWKSLETVETELEVVRMKIKQYGFAATSTDGCDDVPIYWSKEYTITDLMELIVALQKSKALVYRDGTPVSHAALVRLFERTFNIVINDPRKVKQHATTRKIRAIKFLNVLSENFISLRNR